jgi:hypothetical protein
MHGRTSEMEFSRITGKRESRALMIFLTLMPDRDPRMEFSYRTIVCLLSIDDVHEGSLLALRQSACQQRHASLVCLSRRSFATEENTVTLCDSNSWMHACRRQRERKHRISSWYTDDGRLHASSTLSSSRRNGNVVIPSPSGEACDDLPFSWPAEIIPYGVSFSPPDG